MDKAKKDIMIVRLQSGELICVVAPYYKGEDSGAVLTTTGLLGQIVKCLSDYTGDVIDMMSMVMPMHTARRVMKISWESAEGRDDA